MHSRKSILLSAAILPLLACQAAAVTLSNGGGDGDVSVEVSEFGFVFDAVYDPVGAVGAGDVVFSSYVARSGAGGEITDFDRAATTPAELVRQSGTDLVTRFDVDDLQITLTQSVRDAEAAGDRIGSVLSQAFEITNAADAARDFDLYRYMDGDLFLTDTPAGDGGGVLRQDDRLVLYQTDIVGPASGENAFLGITAEGGTAPETGRFRIGPCCGIDTPLDDSVAGDTDGDGAIDTAYDVTMTLRNGISLAAGQSATYTTTTLFGSGAPAAPEPPVAGSSEETPLLPVNAPPVDGVVESFVFDVPVDLAGEGQTVWIDPAVAVGYTYEVTGADFAAVTAPSLGSVADADGYTLRVGDATIALAAGETHVFAAPVSTFEILGIDPALGLDPESGSAFVTGLSFAGIAEGAASITVVKTPLDVETGEPVAPVPLPASGLVLLGGIGALGGLRRRTRRG